ncbi:MAG: SRPBCC family protein [Pseudomonadota bacterium]
MKIDNSFSVPRPIADTWRILLDIPTVVPCIPGVQLTEMVNAREFRLLGTVKLGPVQLTMHGDVEIASADEAAHVAVLAGKGRDNKGRGTANATVTLALSPAGASQTQVHVTTELELAGAIAQYGRGTGLIQAVAGQIVTQFAANLQAQLASMPPPAEAKALPLFQLLWRAFRAGLAKRLGRQPGG